MEPRVTTVELSLDQLRLLAKSVGKTLDAELKKLQRLHPGALRNIIQEDLNTLDAIDAELKDAIGRLVNEA